MNVILDQTLCSVLRIDDIPKYLESVTCLLAQYSWIYRHTNINIFVFDVLEEIPSDWAEILSELPLEELWKVPFGYIKEEWPESLKAFLSKCSELGSFRFSKTKFQDVMNEDNSNSLKKTPRKKNNEVHVMSHLLKNVCNAMECKSVIDIGSGLGHLDRVLHKNFGIYCLGLDSVRKYTSTAQERIKDDSCPQSVLYKTVKVKYSEECISVLKTSLNDLRNLHCSCSNHAVANGKNASSSIMVGLHSCGNFAQDMMKLFCSLDDIAAFVCVGCCFHKSDLSAFPMSSAAKHAVDAARAVNPSWRPCVSGLRLACQGTPNHAHHVFSSIQENNIFYRCVLESYVKRENITWKQPKRHVRKADLKDFSTYCAKMFEGHTLGGDEKTLNELNLLYQEKLGISKRLKILLIFQTLIQPIWEAFVYLDRLMFFRERNISAEVLELWDDTKSPRNLALCAYKR